MALTAERPREECTGPAEPELVSRDDPRYFDLRYFPKPEEGQTWFQAREEQVAATKVRKREIKRGTITMSDSSRRSAGTGWDRGASSAASQATRALLVPPASGRDSPASSRGSRTAPMS